MLNLLRFTLILVLGFQAAVLSQSNDSRAFEREAIKAYQAKDFHSFLEAMLKADASNPNHPRTTYDLAVAYTVNGMSDEAIARLVRLAKMKLFYRLEDDEDFAPLKGNPEFQAVVKWMAENSLPTNNARTAFSIPEKGLVSESLAYDPKTHDFFLASVAKRKILRIRENGKSVIFADRTTGLWSVFGIKIDPARRTLWAVSSAHKQMPDVHTNEVGMTGVFRFDLDSGKLLKKYIVPNQLKAHWLGDLAIARNGDVYATDSISQTIFVINESKDKIEPFLENHLFVSPQGLDFSKDGKFLFIADYAKGVFRISLATKEVTKLIPVENSTMLGIDGLYFHQNSLIATQNGVNPQRAVRMYLSKDLSKVERFKVLEANNPLFDDITLGVLVNQQFYFIANSQWELLGEGGIFAAPEKLKEVNVLKINL